MRLELGDAGAQVRRSAQVVVRRPHEVGSVGQREHLVEVPDRSAVLVAPVIADALIATGELAADGLGPV